MNRYYKLKEKIRQKAINWQNNFSNNSYSYMDLDYALEYFEAKAKRYGLIKEFKENGII